MSSDTQAPVWPGTGEVFHWDPGQRRWETDSGVCLEQDVTGAWHASAIGCGQASHLLGAQEAAGHYAARLQEQHAAIGTVLGVRTADQERADVVAWLPRVLGGIADLVVPRIIAGKHAGPAPEVTRCDVHCWRVGGPAAYEAGVCCECGSPEPGTGNTREGGAMSEETQAPGASQWKACEPYPACDGPDMGWHVRTDDDEDDFVCETGDERTARLIAEEHNAALGTERVSGLRARGWAVAVHNDYRLHGEPHTFWLFTKNGRAVKGEGLTDAEALAYVSSQVDAIERGDHTGGRGDEEV